MDIHFKVLNSTSKKLFVPNQKAKTIQMRTALQRFQTLEPFWNSERGVHHVKYKP